MKGPWDQPVRPRISRLAEGMVWLSGAFAVIVLVRACMGGDAMKTKMVSHTLETPPALTDAQRDHLAELAALPDETIDTSDIPELSDEAWAAGTRGRFYRPAP